MVWLVWPLAAAPAIKLLRIGSKIWIPNLFSNRIKIFLDSRKVISNGGLHAYKLQAKLCFKPLLDLSQTEKFFDMESVENLQIQNLKKEFWLWSSGFSSDRSSNCSSGWTSKRVTCQRILKGNEERGSSNSFSHKSFNCTCI